MKALFVAFALFVFPWAGGASAAPGDILVTDLHETASVGAWNERTIETQGCAPAGSGECIKINCESGDGYAPWTLDIPDGGKTEITIVWWERFDVWPLTWSTGGVKSIRPYHGSGSGDYMAAFINFHGDNSMYMSSWRGATLAPNPNVVTSVVENDGYCSDNSNGTYSCDVRLKYTWEGMGTTWRQMRMWIKMPETFSSGDGEVKLWVDEIEHFHLYDIDMKDTGLPKTTSVKFAPIDETATPHEHWYDEITIYEGYVPPDGTSVTISPRSPTNLRFLD